MLIKTVHLNISTKFFPLEFYFTRFQSRKANKMSLCNTEGNIHFSFKSLGPLRSVSARVISAIINSATLRRVAIHKKDNKSTCSPKRSHWVLLLFLFFLLFFSLFFCHGEISHTRKQRMGRQIPLECPMKFMRLWKNSLKQNLYHLSEVRAMWRNLHMCVVEDQKEILQCKSKRKKTFFK